MFFQILLIFLYRIHVTRYQHPTGFYMQVTKTLAYPILCSFPLFVTVCDHNQYRQTYVMS